MINAVSVADLRSDLEKLPIRRVSPVRREGWTCEERALVRAIEPESWLQNARSEEARRGNSIEEAGDDAATLRRARAH